MTGLRRKVGGAVLLIGLGVGFAVCAALIFVVLGRQYGLVVPIVSAVAAALPVPVLVLCLRWLDRYEPEPVRYLAFTFLWGALVATAGSIVLGIAGRHAFGDVVPHTTSAVWIAPPTEEFGKALPVLLLFVFRRREFGRVIDGISYAAMAGIGFAFTENILYFSQAYVAGVDSGGTARGVIRLLVLFVLRGLLSPFAHPMFAACTGIGLGIAAGARRQWVRVAAPLAGYALAVALHTTWNSIASSGSASRTLAGYMFIMVPALGVVTTIAVLVRLREARAVRATGPAFERAVALRRGMDRESARHRAGATAPGRR